MTDSVAVNILDMFCKNQLDVDKHLSNSCGFPKCEGGVLASGDANEHRSRRFTKPRNNYNMTLVKIGNPIS